MTAGARAEALLEVNTLYDAVEAAVAAMAEATGDPRLGAETLIPRASYLDGIASGHLTPAAALRGLREGLADLSPRGSRYPSEQATEAAFLRAFAARTGQSLWEVAPQPKRRLRVILAAPEAPGEDDLRFVANMLADGAVAPRDVPRCQALLARSAPAKDS